MEQPYEPPKFKVRDHVIVKSSNRHAVTRAQVSDILPPVGNKWVYEVTGFSERFDTDVSLYFVKEEELELTEPRTKADDALERVNELIDKWERIGGPGSRAEEVFGPQKVSVEFTVYEIRKAIKGE